MGHGIASCLIRRTFPVWVWNRTPEKAADLISSGAQWGKSPAEAAGHADLVFSMVADDDASRTVWLGENGALAAMRPGAVMIECSTLSPDHVALLYGEARKRGVRYIDCPVTGLPVAAAEGRLTLLVGADPADLENLQPVLAAFSETIRHFGVVGSGTAYKLMINLMGAVQIAALAEGMALAEKFGLDKEQVVEAIQHSAAASPQVIRNARKMADAQFTKDPVFTVRLRRKDTAYGLSLARTLHADVPLGEAALAWFHAAQARYGDWDEAAVIQTVIEGAAQPS